jgi:hypothetical protein
MEMLLERSTKMYRRQSRNSKTIKIKNMRRHKQQTSELIGALNTYQSGTEKTINREISELRTKIDNIKEEGTHEMENLRKKMKHKYKTQWKANSAD